MTMPLPSAQGAPPTYEDTKSRTSDASSNSAHAGDDGAGNVGDSLNTSRETAASVDTVGTDDEADDVPYSQTLTVAQRRRTSDDSTVGDDDNEDADADDGVAAGNDEMESVAEDDEEGVQAAKPIRRAAGPSYGILRIAGPSNVALAAPADGQKLSREEAKRVTIAEGERCLITEAARRVCLYAAA